MPPTNADDPLRTTDQGPSAATPIRDVTGDTAPASPVVDGATGAYVPGQGTETMGVPPECGPAAVSVPGYAIEGVLGRGGMGVVYRARHLALKRTVALKMVLAGGHAGPRELARFRLEAEAVARLQHPNIVQIHEVGEAGGHPYCALEFVEGGNLAGKTDGKPLPAREAARLVEALARAMQLAHSRNVVHRDLKPANVLLAADGTPKITDFGLARQLDSDSGQTQAGAVMGTPSYMAPEQASGRAHEAGPAADVYALGAILYACLAGRPPFQGQTVVETLDQVRTQEPLPPSRWQAGVPLDVETICLKCLRKEPEKRYASAAELADDLGCYQRGEPILARPVGRLERAGKWVKRNPVVFGAAVAVLLALTVGLAGVVWFAYQAGEEAKAARKAEGKADAEAKAANEAKKREGERADELTHRLGVSNILLAGAAYDNRDVALADERLDNVPAEQRGWDWHYLKQQVRGGLFTLYGHASPVTSVAYSPDGTRIVTGGGDDRRLFGVKMWDARAGTLLFDWKGLPPRIPGASVPVVCVAFSPDSQRIVAAGGDPTARVYDAKTGALRLELKEPAGGGAGDDERLPARGVTCAAFSPDGTRIVTTGSDLARVWDAGTGTALVELKGHRSRVSRVAFSPDGARIVTASFDNTVRLWDARTGTALLDVKGITSGHCRVAFSPDGTRIVTGRYDGIATVIDARTGAVLLELNAHMRSKQSFFLSSPSVGAGVLSAAFSPDGVRIVTVGGMGSGEATVWDARTGAELLDLKGHTSLVRSVAFSPDGTHIVTGSMDGTAKVWDARTGTNRLELGGQRGGASNLAVSPDGTRIVTGSSHAAVKVWDAGTGKILVELKGLTGGPVSFSPDGTRIVTGSYRDRTVKVWDAKTGTAQLELKGHLGMVLRVSFSPDGTRIISADRDTVKVWDARTGTVLLDLKTGSGGVMAISPDGTRIITIDGTTLTVWDAQTGTSLFALKGHTKPVTSASFSPDGTTIVTGSFPDRALKMWDAATGKALSERKGGTGDVSFSPDGRRIVTDDGATATVWDARTGTTLLELNGHPVQRASFSPDGTRIVTAGLKADNPGKPDDGKRDVTVWDARTGTALLELHGGAGWVQSVAFSPDGTRIVSTSARGDDSVGEVNVWDAKTGTALFDLRGFTGSVDRIVFSPDGTRITTGAVHQEQTATVWDARTGIALLELHGGPGAVKSVAFSPDGARIVTAGGEPELPGDATVWDARTGASLVELKGFKEGVNSVAFSPDGARVITAGVRAANSGGGELKVWDTRTGAVLLDLTQPQGDADGIDIGGRGGSLAFSRGGTRFVAGGVRTAKTLGDEVKVCDAQTGAPLLNLKAQMGPVHCVAFSPDGTRIIAGGLLKTARVWDARTGAPQLELKGRTGEVNCVAFSPDEGGTRIVTGSGDRTVRVWDAKTGTALVELKGHTGAVTSVAFTPDGTRIVSVGLGEVGKPGEVIVWDARMAALELRHTGRVVSVAFSPDSTRIVTGAGIPNDPGEVKVWDTRTGAAVLDLEGQTGGVQSVAFSADGTRIVTRAYDKTAKVWDAQTGKELPGEAIPETLADGRTSPDGRLFAHLDGNRVELVRATPDAEEIDYRLLHARPNPGRYQDGYDAARAAKDNFGARFYLDRLLSLPAQRTTERFKERNDLANDPRPIARTTFHHPALAKAPYDRGVLALLAVNGDRLAQRLVAQELLRDGQPGMAIPLLYWCMASRPAASPPVEELLLARAHLDLKQPDEAKRLYPAAAEWLERTGAPKDDPRRNPFDWEAWHECDVFRAEVEKALAIR
jgi:WD40 repeat protein